MVRLNSVRTARRRMSGSHSAESMQRQRLAGGFWRVLYLIKIPAITKPQMVVVPPMNCSS